MFNFLCFQLFEEDPWRFLALFNSSPVSTLHFFQIEVSNQFPTFPHSNLCKTEPHSPDPNFPFLLSQQNIIIFNQDSFAYIPSLKSVFIQVISNLTDHFLLRLTRREPSPDLVGLATRLSVVWCYPRFCLSQPKVDLGHNIVATILGRNIVCLLVLFIL